MTFSQMLQRALAKQPALAEVAVPAFVPEHAPPWAPHLPLTLSMALSGGVCPRKWGHRAQLGCERAVGRNGECPLIY